jgi:hypothetical protein
MDIAPPPSESRKKLKKKRYREKKYRQRLAVAKQNDEANKSKEELQKRLVSKLNQFRSIRTGGDSQTKNLTKGNRKLNPQKLMKKLGLTDPETQKKVLSLVKSGQVRDINTLIEKIKQLVAAVDSKSEATDNSNLRNGKLNPGKLMDYLGLHDSEKQKKILGLLQSGQVQDMNSLVGKIKKLVAVSEPAT